MATRRKTTNSKAKTSKKAASNFSQWSILVFGMGILLFALTYIKGNTGWEWIRQNILFGIFGLGTYVMAPATVYIAFLMATGKRIGVAVIKSCALLIMVCGARFVFSDISLEQKNIIEGITHLHSASTGEWGIGAGVTGALLGWPLVGLMGRPGANIILAIVLVIGIMLITNITPAHLFNFFSGVGGKLKSDVNTTKESVMQKNKLKQQQREQKAAEMAQKERENAAVKAQNAVFDKDTYNEAVKDRHIKKSENSVQFAVFDDEVKTTELNDRDNIKIGPGGTFGMDTYSAEGGAQIEASAEQSQQDPPPLGGDTFTIDARTGEVLGSTIEPAAYSGAGAQQGDDIALMAQNAARTAEGVQFAPPEQKQDDTGYAFPPINLFKKAPPEDDQGIQSELTAKANKLVKTLNSYGVETKILAMSRGPSVTRFELKPLAGVKISKITSLSDDISLHLAAEGVRIEAPIPGRGAIGVEVPNYVRSIVNFRSILESPEFSTMSLPLIFAVGKDIAGNPVVGNLEKMPHLLIAGTTGSGKSVCTNSIIMSLLYRCSPQTLRLMLIDPKMVEFAQYNGIPHLLMPVITEPRKAAGALGSAVAEMEKRYKLLAENRVPNITEYNLLAEEDLSLEPMPYMVVVIDELNDLMMVAGKEVEDYICRLAQKARAAGIHLIVATQRPSVDVITGLIKANIPSRIGMSVMSQIDSRTILDTGGAEKLLGNGDMLYMPAGMNKPVRLQGAYIGSSEIRGAIDYIKKNSDSDYNEEMIAEMEKCAASEKVQQQDAEDVQQDAMFDTAAEVVIDAGLASTSLLQRRCRLGYARAARIIDELELAGVVGPYEGSKPRQVLMSRQQWIEMNMNKNSAEQSTVSAT